MVGISYLGRIVKSLERMKVCMLPETPRWAALFTPAVPIDDKNANSRRSALISTASFPRRSDDADHKHLPSFVLGDPGHENRVVGPVPARRRVDADIAGIRTFIEAFATTVDAVAAAIYHKTVRIAFFLPVRKPLAVWR